MKKKSRRDVEVFSLSFLDVICCGFGAIILLLVLVQVGEPRALEAMEADQKGLVAKLQEELYEIRGETNVLNRDLITKREQISKEKVKVARLRGDFSTIRGEYASGKELSEVNDIVEGRLLAALQELSEEQKRLLGRSHRPRPKDAPIGGIPVDSEYIVFIIDTSGSMQRFAWPLVVEKLEETLRIYPKVKGIQVMNDMGQYMFKSYSGKWIPDTPGRRKVILDRRRSQAGALGLLRSPSGAFCEGNAETARNTLSGVDQSTDDENDASDGRTSHVRDLGRPTGTPHLHHLRGSRRLRLGPPQ